MCYPFLFFKDQNLSIFPLWTGGLTISSNNNNIINVLCYILSFIYMRTRYLGLTLMFHDFSTAQKARKLPILLN